MDNDNVPSSRHILRLFLEQCFFGDNNSDGRGIRHQYRSDDLRRQSIRPRLRMRYESKPLES